MNQFFFMGGIPWWAATLIALGAVALLIYQFRSLRQRLSIGQSALLILLRGSVYSLLILFLQSPVLVEQSISKLRRPLILLLDTSQSMALPSSQNGNLKKSRIDMMKEKLLGGGKSLIDRLARDYDLRLYKFDTKLVPIGAASLNGLGAHGKGTNLLEALKEAEQSIGDAAGIILLSDGIANGTKEPAGSYSFSLPIFSVAVGETEGFTDLRIADLLAPELAFRGRKLKLNFTVKAYGLAGRTVPLYFTRGRNLISTRSITIDRDPFEQQLTFTYTPKKIGPHSFSLSLPLQTGEQITQNNKKEFKVDVQRDKIRVLTLSGSPSWNYRFLRLALKQDPFIDLVSFVFLRTPTDSVDVPENQLSLIPFPIDVIFLEELKNFDLVIFDNLSYRSYFNTRYLEKVRDFTRDGGGLAMLGGVNSFASGGYRESPLNEVLPVELDGTGKYETGIQLRPVLEPAGQAHPITRIFPDPRANQEAWKKMPPLTTLNRVVRSKGEMLLSAAPSGASRGWPLLSVGKFGKGRTLSFMSDDFWRWNFIAMGRKESSQGHQKLIRQAVRWLTQEPSIEQVRIISIGGTRRPGEKMEFRVRVLKDDFTPTSHANLRLRIIGPDGERIPVEVVPESVEGEYSAEFTPTKEGSYELQAAAELSGDLLGKDQKNFLVTLVHEEIEDGRPQVDLFKKLAELTQGEYIPLSQWNEKSLERIVDKLERLSPSQIGERREIPLSSTPWPVTLILLLLGIEWWLRRSWGFV
ncbi:MAG: glutamine amidotransferase [Candidatus Binatia bacterium]